MSNRHDTGWMWKPAKQPSQLSIRLRWLALAIILALATGYAIAEQRFRETPVVIGEPWVPCYILGSMTFYCSEPPHAK